MPENTSSTAAVTLSAEEYLPSPSSPKFFSRLRDAKRSTVPATALLDAYHTLRDNGDERARLVLQQLLDESNRYIAVARREVRRWLGGRGGEWEEAELMSYVFAEIVKGINRPSGRNITAWVAFCVDRFKDARDMYESAFDEEAEVHHPTSLESGEPVVEHTTGENAAWHLLDDEVIRAEQKEFLKEFLDEEIPKLPDEFTRAVAWAYYRCVYEGGPPPPVKGDSPEALEVQFPEKKLHQIKYALYKKARIQLKAAWQARQKGSS